MKFLVISVALCALMAMATAQQNPKVQAMQEGVGSILALVKDLTEATNQVISDTNVQAAMKDTRAALASIRGVYSVFGTTNTSALTTTQRNKLTTAFNAFKNAINALETMLRQFPISPANLTKQLTAVQNAFLALGGSVISL